MEMTQTENSALIDQYIATCPTDIQVMLQTLRETIHTAAPQAQEAFSYSMPTFQTHGNLVHFAAYAKHIGFYPTPSGVQTFQDRLGGYTCSKGAIQFPLNQSILYALVSEIVAFRVQENLEKAAR